MLRKKCQRDNHKKSLFFRTLSSVLKYYFNYLLNDISTNQKSNFLKMITSGKKTSKKHEIYYLLITKINNKNLFVKKLITITYTLSIKKEKKWKRFILYFILFLQSD